MMRRNWREIRTETGWRDMLNLTGLTPELLRERYGATFKKARNNLAFERRTVFAPSSGCT
jgi:hypothetical protein